MELTEEEREKIVVDKKKPSEGTFENVFRR
jgi:hypothetical protein